MFVQYWSAEYDYATDSDLYTPHIGKQLTPETVRELFLWKNGSKLSVAKQQSVEQNYVGRLQELFDLSMDTPPAEFLKTFGGGAIWRIFWLHCWQPSRYPIYDQHVHRAMTFI